MNAPPTVLTGAVGLLAAQIAAHRLVFSDAPVFCLTTPLTFTVLAPLVRAAARRIALDGDEMERRLAESFRLGTAADIASDAEVWHFAEAAGCVAPELLSLFHARCIAAFNEVVTPYAGGGHARWIAGRVPPTRDKDMELREAPSFAVHRVFTTTLTVAPEAPHGVAREGLLYFLGTLLDFVGEIEARLPDYFNHHALRCRTPEHATINIVHAEQAARLVLEIARRADGGHHRIASSNQSGFAELLERSGACCGIRLLPEVDEGALNGVDAAFAARMVGFETHLAPPAEPGQTMAGEDDLLALVDVICDGHRRRRESFAARVAALPASLSRRQVKRGSHPLTYYSSGSGDSTVVLLNALGQSLQCWLPLIECLQLRFRVLVWDLRGVLEPPAPQRMADHVADLKTILENEGTRSCYLVGWCTGPKIAVEYFLKHPDAVCSMVFLNTTFRCFGGPPQLETDYERNFEHLCRVLDQHPSKAAAIMDSLVASATGPDVSLIDQDEGNASVLALEAMSRDLRTHLLRPFSNPDAVVNYAQQLLDFWRHDILKKASQVDVPVLFLSSEYDRIAAPAVSEVAAAMFPGGRWLQVRGASHYFLYDSAEAVAELIEAFFNNPGALGAKPDPEYRHATLAFT
jgi:pimeloyl-ACP methyl ester carboxylesterase